MGCGRPTADQGWPGGAEADQPGIPRAVEAGNQLEVESRESKVKSRQVKESRSLVLSCGS
ncbi:hypothetical protein SBA2_460002 [Acidobacteriia bacterium SbA2]|nr:hypothetical protein SBA2_460002 [Acidobacteriia bacterium SbA2]